MGAEIDPRNLHLARKLIDTPPPKDPKEQAAENFFQDLIQAGKFPISSIYYPGNGHDFTLDKFFKRHQVTYLSKEPQGDHVRYGDFRNSPELLDGIFDAAYIRHLHQRRRDFGEILRTVRPSGLVIYSLDTCITEPKDSMKPQDVRGYPLLQAVRVTTNEHPSILTFLRR